MRGLIRQCARLVSLFRPKASARRPTIPPAARLLLLERIRGNEKRLAESRARNAHLLRRQGEDERARLWDESARGHTNAVRTYDRWIRDLRDAA